ncbi:MAG: AAA-like domain-containing protein [Bacteroidia bacterium]|nr:AAA-like domain-containing protein [Bacteroidia bacterium]
MRYFNTSGPNRPYEHYTLMREKLVEKGIRLVNAERYFTIWAPRQTGKSTYFRLLAGEIEKKGYSSAYINFENYKNENLQSFLLRLTGELIKFWGVDLKNKSLGEIFYIIENIQNKKCVLIIDEVEGINSEYFGDFLHSIRNVYHSREKHCLKSVILVGVTNILGVVQDHASPFNIADNLPIDYFTKEEVYELLHQHETETGQLFDEKVKEKISYITAGQPGLVNGFAWKLVEDNPDKKKIEYDDYLKAEDWYLRKAIDKNISNIINKAKQYRAFVEKLLFREAKITFDIDRESIKVLHTNGIIKENSEKNIEFWVPLYKKRLYKYFFPYENGESDQFFRKTPLEDVITKEGKINFEKLIEGYKSYVKRRSFKYFREKDDDGNYKNIKEAALVYSFETYIQYVIQEYEGKSYLEPHTGLGRSDLIINILGNESVIETKIYKSILRFIKGKKQLAYYCKSIGVKDAVYLVFTPNNIDYTESVKEQTEKIDGIKIRTYLIEYDEEKDF